MAKLCTDCGAPIYTSWNVCAECGAPVLTNRKISHGIQGGAKIRRIKISIIITMVIGLVIVISQGSISLIIQMTNISHQSLSRAFDAGTITWEQYISRVTVLEDQNSLTMMMISIAVAFAGIFLNIAFIFVIIGFLSISFDTVFKEKTRRMYLIITSVFIIFYFYMILTVSGV
jgi:hypothetical protein